MSYRKIYIAYVSEIKGYSFYWISIMKVLNKYFQYNQPIVQEKNKYAVLVFQTLLK